MSDDPLEQAARRIVEANQKARGQFAERASRLADALITDSREDFTDAVNDILAEDKPEDDDTEPTTDDSTTSNGEGNGGTSGPSLFR